MNMPRSTGRRCRESFARSDVDRSGSETISAHDLSFRSGSAIGQSSRATRLCFDDCLESAKGGISLGYFVATKGVGRGGSADLAIGLNLSQKNSVLRTQLAI